MIMGENITITNSKNHSSLAIILIKKKEKWKQNIWSNPSTNISAKTLHLCSLLLTLLSNEGLVDVRDHTWKTPSTESPINACFSSSHAFPLSPVRPI
jgi:hypothetical protein